MGTNINQDCRLACLSTVYNCVPREAVLVEWWEKLNAKIAHLGNFQERHV